MNKISALQAVMLCLLAMASASCGNTRPFVYMQGKFDTARLSDVKAADPIIQKGDLLSIIVYSDNAAATALYNQPVTGTAGAASQPAANSNSGGGSGSTAGTQQAVAAPSTPGYLVDEAGNIHFQGLGLLHVEGLTKEQLKALLDEKLKDFLTNPYYNIRFLNYRFTMLGEVSRPGVYTMPGEQLNILQALGLAGDMTFYGRRDNVLVIREVNGKRQYGRLDLTKPEIMESPFFYLQQNDVVIFEPSKKKIVANDQVTVRNVSIAATVVTTLAILVSLFRK